MEENQILEYIKKYQNQYSKETLELQLKKSGASQEEINLAFKKLENNNFTPKQNQKSNGKSIGSLIFGILGFFIPLLGIGFSITGIILGNKAEKINPNDTLAKVGKIISIITLILQLLIIPIIAIVGFQSWFTTYQSGINVKVEQQSRAGSSITIERLESEGTVYIKNLGVTEIIGATISIPDTSCQDGNIDISSQSVNDVKLSNCNLIEGKDYPVVAITDTGVFQATMIAR